MLFDISDRQLDQNLEHIKTSGGLDLQFHQNYMQSFISFILRLNLDFHCVFIIRYKCRGIVDECALNGATNLLPRVLFVVELESHDKHDHCVDVNGDVPLLTQSLQRIFVTWRTDVQGH
jgi:hypothetical protein